MKEIDGMHYFRLQRSFDKISQNLIFFEKITKNHFLFGEECGNYGVYFIDLETSYSSFSSFKTEIIENLQTSYTPKNTTGTIYELFTNSLKYCSLGGEFGSVVAI